MRRATTASAAAGSASPYVRTTHGVSSPSCGRATRSRTASRRPARAPSGPFPAPATSRSGGV
eukprot:6628967-Lingulodinium_polyedra.AAC.1